MPFWQNTALAPEALMVATILRSMFSSSSRNACIWVGSVISILASISVFLISNATSSRAILAFSILLGMPGCTGSLSTMMPGMSWVSSMEPPCFLVTWMLSMSTCHLPLTFSATLLTESTDTWAMSSLEPEMDLLIMAVLAIFRRVSRSFGSTLTATESSTSMALLAAMRYPAVMMVGWTLASIRSMDFFNSSPVRTTAVVVPSPHSSSWVLATSTSILAAGCSTSISFNMVTPSLVMTTSPMESTSILSIPRGPRVLLTASAMALAAMMLLYWASLPFSRLEPSLSISIGAFPIAMLLTSLGINQIDT
ncbi:MAG: hypothetical protein A4E30_01431 [Methanomassiliicoccales archaeon PtaB.Bin215]|nr:MAG: hypothetical protein A4E30_01431 [Methanomassiliicoccales archaeon PtaB.Bin215]